MLIDLIKNSLVFSKRLDQKVSIDFLTDSKCLVRVIKQGRKQNFKDFIYQLLTKCPIALFNGGPSIFPYLVAQGLFGFHHNENVHIENINFTNNPTKILVSCHHRRNCSEMVYNDILLQFLVSRYYSNHAVVYDFGGPKPGPLMRFIHDWFWRGKSLLDHNDSDSKYQFIVDQAIRPNSMTCVFPDRDGSMLYDDYKIVFRPGLFAASMYLQVPILDILVSQGTESNDTFHVQLKMWTPPSAEHVSTSDDSYSSWRLVNANAIDTYTLECEKDYISRLKLLNDSKISCKLEPEMECRDTIVEAGQRRNNKAYDFRDSLKHH